MTLLPPPLSSGDALPVAGGPDREFPSARRRIALVCDWFAPRLGGIERHLAGLGQNLVAHGHEVALLTPMPAAETPAGGVRLVPVAGRTLPIASVLASPAGYRQLGHLLRTGGYDVVHVHTSILSPAGFAALFHASRAGLPTVNTLHSMLGRYRPVFRALDRLLHWSRWPVLHSSVSERAAAAVAGLVGRDRVVVLPNAVDPTAWRLEPDPPTDAIAIAAVMRLVPRKRGGMLLRALATAAAKLPPGRRLRVEIAGVGPERRRLERRAAQLPPNVEVRFLGAQSPAAVKALLARSHLFVLPSRLEAFGIAALEARAAGLPILALRAGGVSEFVEHGRDGLLAGDDAEFAAMLGQLCVNDALRNRIAAHNRRVPVACTWDRVVALHLAAYARAAELAGVRAGGNDHRW